MTDNPKLNRRSLLGRGVAAAFSGGAIGATVGAAIAQAAAAPVGDAELLALDAEIAEADKAFNAALDVRSEAEGAFAKAKPQRPIAPDYPDVSDEEWLKALLRKTASDEARPEVIAHEAAKQEWIQKCERLKEECGLVAAEFEESEASDEVLAIRDFIAETRATTLAGLVFKAKYAAGHYRSEYDLDVMTSIVDDLLTMAGEEADDADDV